MKKFKVLMPTVAMLLMSLNFVGCKDTDEPVVPEPPVVELTTAEMLQKVSGKYNGMLVETDYYANTPKPRTTYFTAYMNLVIDNQSGNYAHFTEAKYMYNSDWTTLIDDPKSLFSISKNQSVYTLKKISSSSNFSFTINSTTSNSKETLTLSMTLGDERDANGLGLVTTFEGTITK